MNNPGDILIFDKQKYHQGNKVWKDTKIILKGSLIPEEDYVLSNKVIVRTPIIASTEKICDDNDDMLCDVGPDGFDFFA